MNAVTPQRVQRKRSKGWQMPGNTVYVGRPSKWGNPFTVVMGRGLNQEAYAEAVAHYRDWLAHPNRAKLRAEAIEELKGKHLACWCVPSVACHADVLLEVANAGTY